MTKTVFKWAVVGAGPAGIAAIGCLLDQGIDPDTILWLDPDFKVGDLGRYWQTVSSNTRVRLFLDFLNACPSFAFQAANQDFTLQQFDPDDTCELRYIVEPLQWITKTIQKTIQFSEDFIHELKLTDRIWHLKGDNAVYQAKNVILATGAVAETLNYPGIEAVPFEVAMNQEKLRQSVTQSDTCAVFGSSHSAVIALNHLVDLGVHKIINFYRSPCRYAINMGDWILFDNTGLKGKAADWARQHLDGTLPKNLVRYTATESNLARFLPECDKAIYAVGFKRRNNILINDREHLDYNPHLGIIAPGLFGLGIAFPELKKDAVGNEEYQVGLWKFMTYLQKVMPVWLQYPS